MHKKSIKLKGSTVLPGDKSISHRLLMVGSIINDQSKIFNLSNCQDVLTTIECLKECNVEIKLSRKNNVKISGGNLTSPINTLDCKNSGTTARMMLGLLSGQGVDANLTGDESLLKRPMKRIIKPLKDMGLNIDSRNMKLPITIKKSKIKAIDYKIKTNSAQVKSALMFAALGSDDYSTISYNSETRNHTEKILKYLSYDIKINDRITVRRTDINNGFKLTVPGDISSASFLIAAAVLIPGSKIEINNVLYNKTRLGFIYVLKKMNANISIININKSNFESTCTITAAFSSNLKSVYIDSKNTVGMIDEIPILSIIATQCTGTTVIDGIKELKYKESDRGKAIYENLKKMSASIEYFKNKITIKGGNKLYNTTIMHYNDHRIAMSFEVLHLLLNNKFSNQYSDIIKISFPNFYSKMGELIE